MGCLPGKGREAAALAEASALMGAPALDPGLRSPAGTNLPGREKQGARQQGAQLTKDRGPLLSVSLCQTDRHQPGASSTWQRRPSHHFCPNKRPGRVRETPRIHECRGANLRLRRVDLFPFMASDFGGSPEHLRRDMVPFSVFCSFPIVVANAGLCLLLLHGNKISRTGRGQRRN